MIIRYYYLSGYATRIVNSLEEPLTQSEFNDFILNKKARMKVGYSSLVFKYQEYHDNTN